jgi:hypothetical protein
MLQVTQLFDRPKFCAVSIDVGEDLLAVSTHGKHLGEGREVEKHGP